jgi:two-component system, OmpR family, sensor histidine kinase QseC
MASKPGHPWSLRTRLIALLSGVVAVIWLVGGILIYFQAEKQGEELADRELRESALLLLSLAQHEILEHGGPFSEIVSPAAQTHAHYLVFQIWDKGGRLVYRSVGAGAEPLMPPTTVGYSQRIANGEPWRVFSAWDDQQNLQIQVGETVAHRRETTASIFSRLGVLVFFLLPMAIVLIWAIIGSVFEPLETSARDVSLRSPDDLREVGVARAPLEVRPLLDALNQLLGRVRSALEHERTFTADAAHELRTPLAAIRTTAQVLGDATDPEDIKSSVQDLLEGVDRSTRVVEQLLLMARMDSRHPGVKSAVDLEPIVLGEYESQRRYAKVRGVALEVDVRPVSILGNADRLRILLRNLVDNAIRYTPKGGTVRVACGPGSEGQELTVSDSGVGIPPEVRQRVFERFFRVVGNDASGSGLGLSIVQRIAGDHGARIEMRDGLAGTGITFAVVFPATPVA